LQTNRAIIFGSLTLDTIKIQGKIVKAKYPGGTAFYAAAAASCQGVPVAVAATAGKDFPLQLLRDRSIDLGLLETQNRLTNHHVLNHPLPGGNAVLETEGTVRMINDALEQVPQSAVDGAYVFIGGFKCVYPQPWRRIAFEAKNKIAAKTLSEIKGKILR
jgi:sugar/nucleoside kinase (ribokinase family)